MESMERQLNVKEKYLKFVKNQKPNTTMHTVIGFIVTLGVLLGFM